MPAGDAQIEGEPADVDARARDLLDRMTGHEVLRLLAGDGAADVVVAGALPRLGLAGIRLGGAPGDGTTPGATAFPAAVARGATFDPVLEERVGDAMGAECRARGRDLAAVCANLLYHPAWDRADEAFGEDPQLVGEMAAALVRGLQRHVMAAVGSLPCPPPDATGSRADVVVDEDDLAEVHLPPFRRCVDAGAAAVTTADHRVNGEPCGCNGHLLGDVLKGEWGFDGFVAGLGTPAPGGRAVAAGQDLQVLSRWRLASLERQVRRGAVPYTRVEDAALRLVRQQLRYADRASGPGRDGGPAATVAGEVAERSMVLLRNEEVAVGGGRSPVLPLDPARVRSLAVLGALATVPVATMPGRAVPAAAPGPGAASILDGLRAAGERHLVHVDHRRGDDLDAAGLAAAAADVAVVVVGDAGAAGGPGGRRHRRPLALAAADEALIRTASAANPRTVVVLLAAGPVLTEGWRGQTGALLVAWYPGAEGAGAVARLLFGEAEPGGRLPCTWPQSAEQLPPLPPGAGRVRYGPLHGYRLMEATTRSPAFPFGFGLGYTTFEHGRVTATRRPGGGVQVAVPVVNTGVRPGDDVVQVYLDQALGSERRPLRTLRAFRRVTVAPGELRDVTLELDPASLGRAARTAAGAVRVHVGRDADPAGHRTVEL